MGRVSDVNGALTWQYWNGCGYRMVLFHAGGRLHIHAGVDGDSGRQVDPCPEAVGILPSGGRSVHAVGGFLRLFGRC